MLLWVVGNKQMVGTSGAVAHPYLDIYLPYLWNTSWALHLYRKWAGNDVTSLGDTKEEHLTAYLENMKQKNTDLERVAYDSPDNFTLTWHGHTYSVERHEEAIGKKAQSDIMNFLHLNILLVSDVEMPPDPYDQYAQMISDSIQFIQAKRCFFDSNIGKFQSTQS